jgi:hypothetical protein
MLHITKSPHRHVTRFLFVLIVFPAAVLSSGRPPAQAGDARHQGYDQILDSYVRDGLVYYRTLKGDRARLDAFVASNQNTSLEAASRETQIAFWLNAYNALVLQAIVTQYPIPQRNREYPARSIRQISGAFDRTPHRVAGRTLTLDQIEQTVLPTFSDPRLFLALGRGAMGSGRLRSEAYTAALLERQLSEIPGECVTRAPCFNADPGGRVVRFSSVFSWRESEFVKGYADKAPALFAARSPVERAMLAFVGPRLLTTEREFMDRNDFRVEFIPFDWSLNDLTGRGDRR